MLPWLLSDNSEAVQLQNIRESPFPPPVLIVGIFPVYSASLTNFLLIINSYYPLREHFRLGNTYHGTINYRAEISLSLSI